MNALNHRNALALALGTLLCTLSAWGQENRPPQGGEAPEGRGPSLTQSETAPHAGRRDGGRRHAARLEHGEDRAQTDEARSVHQPGPRPGRRAGAEAARGRGPSRFEARESGGFRPGRATLESGPRHGRGPGPGGPRLNGEGSRPPGRGPRAMAAERGDERREPGMPGRGVTHGPDRRSVSAAGPRHCPNCGAALEAGRGPGRGQGREAMSDRGVGEGRRGQGDRGHRGRPDRRG